MRGDGSTISFERVLTKSDTDEVMQIHAISGYIATLFLCEYVDRGEFLMLDGGAASDGERVAAYIHHVNTERGRVQPGTKTPPPPLKDSLKLVVATHAHMDHVGGGAGYIKAGIPVVPSNNIDGLYDGSSGSFQRAADHVLGQFVAWRLGRRPIMSGAHPKVLPPLSKADLDSSVLAGVPPQPLSDLSPVPGFEDWIAIHAPGHTTHMVLLYHPASRILYAADMILRQRRGEFWSPVPVDVDWAYSHTLHRLRGLDVRFLMMAHGGIADVEEFGGWGAILDEVATHAARKGTSTLFLSFIERFLTGRAPEHRAFTREMLSRRPLPVLDSPAKPAFHMR